MSTRQTDDGRVGENYGPVLAASGPKFKKFRDDVGDSS